MSSDKDNLEQLRTRLSLVLLDKNEFLQHLLDLDISDVPSMSERIAPSRLEIACTHGVSELTELELRLVLADIDAIQCLRRAVEDNLRSSPAPKESLNKSDRRR
jgi:hypothetical protein